jgi:hypothetical protein
MAAATMPLTLGQRKGPSYQSLAHRDHSHARDVHRTAGYGHRQCLSSSYCRRARHTLRRGGMGAIASGQLS